MELPPQIQAQLMQLQQLQQQLQMILMQKQSVETELKECKKALEELEKSSSDEVYKLVGGLFVKRKKEDVKKELEEKVETLELRVKNIREARRKITVKIKRTSRKDSKNDTYSTIN